MKLEYHNFTTSDVVVVAKQLRSQEVLMCAVAERCIYGYPRIIVLSPIKSFEGVNTINYEALRNVFWLTCPFCNDVIHKLENNGYISKIAEFINSNRVAREWMRSAHSHMYFVRKKLYKDFFSDMYPQEMIKFFDSGVGGVKDGSAIKCLHAHFAFYRINPINCAGYIVQKLLSDIVDCDTARCKDENL
ncbi:MAG: DUF501 domain-containing protein [Spirochaetes bacterium]|nr:DUF501 domain-containing protein [Spirochaetota bacterium]